MIKTIENPDLVDVNSNHHTTVVLNDKNIVLHINGEGIIIDFWDNDSDCDAHATIGLDYDQWRKLANRLMEIPQ